MIKKNSQTIDKVYKGSTEIAKIYKGSTLVYENYRDIIVSGINSILIRNAKANSLNYLKLFGACEQNGTPTPANPVDIECNNGAVKYGVLGKNLNGGTIDHKGYASTGSTSNSTTFAGTLWQIPCTEGQKFTTSWGGFPDGVSGVFVNTWNTDGSWNRRQAISASTSLTYTIGEGIGMVNFTLYKTGGVTIGDDAWMQVEYGSTATSYEPYRAGIYADGTPEVLIVGGENLDILNVSAPQTASVVNLFAVDNYKDEQDLISGTVMHKVGVKVLDGTEKVTIASRQGLYGFHFNLSDRVRGTVPSYNTHFTNTYTYMTTNYGMFDNNLFNANTTETDVKTWLSSQYNAGTPVIIVYPLAESTTESVTVQTLNIQKGTNIIEITQASLDNLELEVKFKGKSVPSPEFVTNNNEVLLTKDNKKFILKEE